MINLDVEEMGRIQRVKAVSIDSLREMGVAATKGTLGMAEVMLEVCDESLEVMISEAELRLLLELYSCLYEAQPFAGLHEAVVFDSGLDFFFGDLKVLMTVLDPTQRAQAWQEVFRDFELDCRRLIFEQTPWVLALRGYGEAYVSSMLQLDLAKASKSKRYLN